FGAAPSAHPAPGKHLPLDGVPNAVPKSPQNSIYAPDRIIIKLAENVTPGAAGAPGKTAFGVAALDEFVRQYAPRSIRQMFPNPKPPAKPGGVDLTRFYEMEYSSPVDAFKVA